MPGQDANMTNTRPNDLYQRFGLSTPGTSGPATPTTSSGANTPAPRTNTPGLSAYSFPSDSYTGPPSSETSSITSSALNNSTFDSETSEGLTSFHNAGRRERNDSDAFYNTAPRSRIPGQQLRNDAKQKAQECGLAAEQTAEVVKFCDLSLIEMVIDLKTHLLKNENDLLKRYFRIFVRHPDFALRLRHVVAAILLAPNTPAYHSGILNQVANHIEKNLDWVGLPASCKRDPADWALVKSAISHELAQMRSSMKSKLDMALKNKQDIYLLTTALMMYEMRAKREHWGRVAFLRSCASSWNQLTAVKKKATPFWDHVDQELKSVRATMNETYVSADRRRVEEAKFFADMVLRDVQTYAVTAGQLQMAVHTNDTLTDLQRNAEQVAGTFIAENTPAGAANADDDVEDLGLNVETGF